MNELIGHARQRGLFESILIKGRLHHAYCFVGPEHIGKNTFAKHLAARLLRVAPEKLTTAPDFFYLTRGRDEKTDKLKKDISVEQVRELIGFVRQTSFIAGGYKVALIDEAENLSLSAANSLLKVLEEPGEKTILILVTADESKILPTVLSRTERWYFFRVPEAELLEYTTRAGASAGMDDATARAMARAADGRPGFVVQWFVDESAFRAYRAQAELFWSLFGASFHDKLARVSGLYGDKKDHIAARDELAAALGQWLEEVRLALRRKYLDASSREAAVMTGAQAGAGVSLDSSVLLKLANILPETGRNLERNIHPRLLIERVLLNIP